MHRLALAGTLLFLTLVLPTHAQPAGALMGMMTREDGTRLAGATLRADS